MRFPAPWHDLFTAISDNPSIDLIPIARRGYEHLDDLLAVASISRDEFQREIALVALWRSFLSSLPASVLERPEEPCKAVVRVRLRHLLGEDPEEHELQS